MSAPETRFAVLLFTDIVGSTELKARHGVPAYSEALRAHNGHFERIAHECLNIRTLQSRGDGYFAEAGSIAEAVRFALLFEEAMREGPWGEVRLAVRFGIHAGEVGMLIQEDGTWIVGPAADLAARITDLAMGGQILLTRFPFDEARHFIREHPPIAGKTMPPLCWLAHGPYLLRGRDEPMDIFEVGAEGLAPLTAPPDGDKAKRAIRPGEEETLGWRPAVGLEIPGRTGWQLTERLGAGGFGEVWTGEHAKLHQRRAFKFCFDDERLRALKREVTLVRLLRSALGERDDIVRIHELKLDAPPFYLESDLAPHGNLLQWAESQGGLDKIPLAQRIALVAHTATALAAAHSIGVLHKDIKPTNILIFDGPGGEPRPRLVDFGIGTLADPAVLGEHGVTAAGFTRATIQHSTGTPTYSPPEYLAGKPYTIQGDIYGLGVLLYQLITVKPLDPLAQGWEREIADPLLREDIATCVDGDPARRLPSAADLAERLLHLDQRRAEIVEKERFASEASARAAAAAAAVADRSRAIRLRKLAAAFAILALLAIAGGVLAWWQRGQAIEQREKSRAMLIEAARSDCSVAEERLTAGDEQAAFAHLARACEYDPASTFAAEKAIAALNTWKHRFSAAILASHTESVWSVEFSPDGTRIVTASGDKTARVWDAITGKNLATLVGHTDRVNSTQFSPDGSRVVTASDDNTARVWEAATGTSLATLTGHEDGLHDAQFSPDGARIVTASGDKTARVWDAATGKTLATLTGHEGGVNDAHFNPDGTRIVTASDDTTARVWDTATGQNLVVLARHETAVNSARFSNDGMWIVTASGNLLGESKDNTARLWEAASGKLLATLIGHEQPVLNAQFDSLDNLILTASFDETARVWEIASIAPDGSRFVTVSGVAILTGHQNALWSAKFSPDGRRIVTASFDDTARVWDTVAENLLATPTERDGVERDERLSPDGRRIVAASPDNTAQVRDAVTGKTLTTLVGHTDRINSTRFSPDGTRIVTASQDKTARVWDAVTGKSLATLSGHEHGVGVAQFSPDHTRIVTASWDESARVWDAPSGQSLVILIGHKSWVLSAQFSTDGFRIVTAGGSTARVWDAVTGGSLATLAGHKGVVHSAHFSPDGLRIVTSSEDKTARVWDAATGRSLATLASDQVDVRDAQFSPDGTHIVATSDNDTARIWTILPPSAGSPPEWFPDFLRYMAQMRLNSDGELETLKPDDWLALRERMRAVRRASAGQDTPYLRILRRFVPE